MLSLLALATLGGLTKNINELTLSSVAVSGVISSKHCQCARAFTQTFNKPSSDNYLSSTKNLVIRALKTLLLITLNFNLYYIAYKTIKRMIIQVQTVKTEGNCLCWSNLEFVQSLFELSSDHFPSRLCQTRGSQ